MMDVFDALRKSASLNLFEKEIQGAHSLVIEGLGPSAKAFISAHASNISGKSLLILAGAGPEEFKLSHNLPFFTQRPLIELPAWETLPSENIAPSPDIVGARLRSLQTLSQQKGPVIVLSTLQGCLQKVVARSTFEKQ